MVFSLLLFGNSCKQHYLHLCILIYSLEMNASARDVNRHHTHLHTKMNVNRTLLSRWETAKYTARKREGGREENITLSVHSIYVLCLMWYATSWLIHLNQTTIISYSSQFEENKNWPQFGYSRLQFPNDMFLNILPIICWLSVYFTKWEWTCLFFPTSFHFVNNGIHSILQTYRWTQIHCSGDSS